MPSIAEQSIAYANDTIARWIEEAEGFGSIPEAQKLRACKTTIVALASKLLEAERA